MPVAILLHQTFLIVGTIFEKSRTSLRKGFWAIFLVAHDKRGISAVALAQEIQVTYKTAWLMLHKIRHAMQLREKAYRLSGIVEMDEAYVRGPGEEPKRGWNTHKTPTLVALSLHPDGKPCNLRMQAGDNDKKETLIRDVNHAKFRRRRREDTARNRLGNPRCSGRGNRAWHDRQPVCPVSQHDREWRCMELVNGPQPVVLSHVILEAALVSLAASLGLSIPVWVLR